MHSTYCPVVANVNEDEAVVSSVGQLVSQSSALRSDEAFAAAAHPSLSTGTKTAEPSIASQRAPPEMFNGTVSLMKTVGEMMFNSGGGDGGEGGAGGGDGGGGGDGHTAVRPCPANDSKRPDPGPTTAYLKTNLPVSSLTLRLMACLACSNVTFCGFSGLFAPVPSTVAVKTPFFCPSLASVSAMSIITFARSTVSYGKVDGCTNAYDS